MNETTPMNACVPHESSADNGPRRCQAKSKQTGRQCGHWAVPNRKVCRYHGGASPQPGPSHHRYKHGKYSKALRGLGDLKQKYERARKDPELCSSADDIALLSGLMEQTLESAGRDGNSRAALELQVSLTILASEFTRAADQLEAGNPLEDLSEHCRNLGRGEGEMGRAMQLAKDLIAYRTAIEHWRRLAEQIRRTRESEAKRQTALAAVVTFDQFNLMMSKIG